MRERERETNMQHLSILRFSPDDIHLPLQIIVARVVVIEIFVRPRVVGREVQFGMDREPGLHGPVLLKRFTIQVDLANERELGGHGGWGAGRVEIA
jgi:hypothetical protein